MPTHFSETWDLPQRRPPPCEAAQFAAGLLFDSLAGRRMNLLGKSIRARDGHDTWSPAEQRELDRLDRAANAALLLTDNSVGGRCA